MSHYYEVMPDTLAQVMKKIPRQYFVKTRGRAYRSIAQTLLICGLSLFFIYRLSLWDSWMKWPFGLSLAWLVLGTALTGAFDLAHDAAHRSLFNSVRENNIWGHFFSSLVGWPFHLWRHAHNLHHKYTNHGQKDVAWEPYPEASLVKISPFYRWAFVTIKSNVLVYWLGGVSHLWEQVLKFKKHKRFAAADRPEIWFSFVITTLIFSSYMALTLSWGWFGFVAGFLVPIARYYYWLTTFTMLHHLHPEKPFLDDAAWQKYTGAAQLLGTINVRYGPYVDFLTHNIGWHIPHHVSVAIPHYHLKDATLALQKAYPGLLHEEQFSLKYLLYILRNCQTIYSKTDLRWKRFAHIEARQGMTVDAINVPS